MKNNHKIKLENYKTGILTLQIESFMPEKFVNILWKNNVKIKKLKKKSLTTYIMQISLKDYPFVDSAAKKTGTRLKIMERKGLSFSLIKMRRRVAFFGGVIVFIGLLYYFSTFIWRIEIYPDKNISPFEIRQQLKLMGMVPGIRKNKVNIYSLEQGLIKSNENIMWVRIRELGAALRVDVAERQIPPLLTLDNSPCNLVARKDGQILRIYTSSGTPAVKAGDIVKNGQLLVKGEQGKEGSTYQVHAKGSVIAKTYYEEKKTVAFKGIKTQRTGNKVVNYFIQINNRKIYIKNSKINYKKYEKEVTGGLLQKEIYYEVVDKPFKLDPKKLINEVSNELYSKVIVNLDKSVKIIGKAVDSHEDGNDYNIRLVVTVEEDISSQAAISVQPAPPAP